MLIGIAGRKRAGKTTLARGLSEALDLPVHTFAEPLRAFVAHILGMSVDELEIEKETPIDWLDGVTPRQMLQSAGTLWGRQMVHPEIWVRSLVRRLPRNGAIVADVRFPNEAATILARRGIVIEVEREGCASDSHISETPLPRSLVTFRVRNDSTPEALVDNTLETLARLRSVA